MADSILRLRVDSAEYNNKLKQATEQLTRYADGCRKAGGTLQHVDDNVVEFARSLGKMETSATSARGQLAEMTKAFTEWSVRYNKLTDEEKKGEFGKALSQSLDQLKGRIQDSKTELDDINKSINGGGGLTGALDNMLGKVGLNVEGLMKFGGAAGAATTALKVAKDAFFASETSLDEWGRTVQSSQSLYQGFLSALNNSDISGFLSRMDEIVSAARDAYNAMDELGTFSAFQQRNVAKGRAGYAQALDEYRLNPTADNKQKLQQANQKVMNDLRESHDKTEAAYQAALRQIATERISGKGMQDAFVKMFSEGNYGDLQAAKSSYKTGRGLNSGAQYYYGNRVYDGRVQDRTTGKWRDMSNTEKQQFEFARALSQVNDSQIKEVQALGAQSVAITEQIYQQDRAYNRLSGNNTPLRGGGGSGGGSKGGSGKTTTAPTYAADSIAAQSALVSDLRKKWSEAGEAVRNDLLVQLIAAEDKLKSMNNQAALFRENQQGKLLGNTPDGNGIQTTGLGSISISEQINEASKGLQGDALKAMQNLIKGGNDAQKSWKNAASAIGSVGSALAGINNPAAKIMGIVAEAVANIALGFAMATAKDSKLGVFGWIAAIAGGLGTMMSTISAIHSATGYAEGGVIKGNSFSGDSLLAQGPDGGMIGLNAGEVVLNRAQAGVLASAIQDGGGGNGRIVGVLRGEDIALVADRWGRRTGKGELAFFK
jgi:hypothetical protein